MDDVHNVTLLRQSLAQGLGQRSIVFNDQNAHG
jgi:hypothetical protein